MVKHLVQKIESLKNVQQVIKIDKGFSMDEKYMISLRNSVDTYFIRFFPLNQLEEKRNECQLLKSMEDFHVKAIRAVDMGEIAGKGYMLTTYLEGDDAERVLPTLASSDQYKIGFEAGVELSKMHQLKAPEHIQSWYERKRIKHENYIEAYKKCGINIQHDEKIMNFIDQHVKLMIERPNIFQHDDFHPGNLIIKNNCLAGIIDFGRYDYGDPIHEFLKIGIFTRNVSIPFSIGQIKGYFLGEEPPEEFWQLYSLYLAMCIFSTVVWTLKVIPDDIENMLQKINVILKDHDYFQQIKPSWYEETF